jgi:hypothetical protein
MESGYDLSQWTGLRGNTVKNIPRRIDGFLRPSQDGFEHGGVPEGSNLRLTGCSSGGNFGEVIRILANSGHCV